MERRGLRQVFVATVMGATVLCLTMLIPAQPASASFSVGSGGRVNGYEATLLTYVNNARVSRGIPALVAATGTNDMARGWSNKMAGLQVLSHNPLIGVQTTAAGSAGWRAIAENVGYASACDPKQLFDAYWASTGHRTNMLNRAYRYVGIGTVERATTGWSCGRAWNTMDFVDAYSSTYGAGRNPPQGMAMDSRTISTTQSLASFEAGSDPRLLTSLGGSGMNISRPVVATPTAGDDPVNFWLSQSSPLPAWGSMYVRDAVDLRSTRQVRVTLRAVTGTGRGLPVSLTVFRDWGATANLGTVTADSVLRTYTFDVPTSIRAFNNNFRVTVSNQGLTALSTVLSLRTARVSVYSIDLIV